jgi:hypothetical protein
VAADLLCHLDRLPDAGEDYRAAFLRRANAFLDAAGPRTCDALAPDDRDKWRLVRERRLPELLELLELQRTRRPPAPASWLIRRIPERHRRLVPLTLRKRVIGTLCRAADGRPAVTGAPLAATAEPPRTAIGLPGTVSGPLTPG